MDIFDNKFKYLGAACPTSAILDQIGIKTMMTIMITRFRSITLASFFLLSMLVAPLQTSALPVLGGHSSAGQIETSHHHESATHQHADELGVCSVESDCSESTCDDCPNCAMCLNIIVSTLDHFNVAIPHHSYMTVSFSTASLQSTTLFKPPRT